MPTSPSVPGAGAAPRSHPLTDADVAEFVDIRHALHRQPELGFEEHRTAALVAERLRSWGYQVTEGIGGTGVVGQLVRGQGTRRLGIRADMDALPIEENTGLPWSSCHQGVMHACGHDGHTATLLAAAWQLAQHGAFDGTLNVIFQPAEEGGGGALRMMDDGLFERFPCDAVFALHNMPGVPVGHMVFRDGAFLASSDYATITLTGKGGHGAMPHKAQDPIVAAASLVMALQTIVSRNVDPLQSAVVTVGSLHSGQANNVIPGSATLELSVRALDAGVRKVVEQRLKEIAAAQAASFGVQVQVDWRSGYTVLVNSAPETDFARQVAVEMFGPQQVTLQGAPLPASEDFAFMLERVPGCYLLIGNGDGDGHGACMVHNPGYDFNDQNIAIGASYWIRLAESFLSAR